MHIVHFVHFPVRYFIIVLKYFMIFLIMFASDITGALRHACFIIYFSSQRYFAVSPYQCFKYDGL